MTDTCMILSILLGATIFFFGISVYLSIKVMYIDNELEKHKIAIVELQEKYPRVADEHNKVANYVTKLARKHNDLCITVENLKNLKKV